MHDKCLPTRFPLPLTPNGLSSAEANKAENSFYMQLLLVENFLICFVFARGRESVGKHSA